MSSAEAVKRMRGIWKSMRQRCSNPNSPFYYRYGGRGIRVAERWNDFRNFLADMGVKPEGRSLDRIDNDGHYEPGNCRWATPKEQAMNRSCSRGGFPKILRTREQVLAALTRPGESEPFDPWHTTLSHNK